jgi:hypothetical protein
MQKLPSAGVKFSFSDQKQDGKAGNAIMKF